MVKLVRLIVARRGVRRREAGYDKARKFVDDDFTRVNTTDEAPPLVKKGS